MFPRSAVRRPPSFAVTVRVLESLESRLAPAAISSATTYVTEVLTNTLQVVELFDTRVYASGSGAVAGFQFAFDRTLPVRYDPAEPTVAAAVAEAVAHTAAGFPGRTVSVITSADVQLGGIGGPTRTYPQTFRLLTRVDPAPVEVGRSDTIVETVTVETVGPATVRVGANAAESLFVPAGDTHTNTVTRVRRDIATVSSQTYTTTQLVLVNPDAPTSTGGGVTTFTTSYRHTPVLLETTAADPARETAAVRVVGTFDGRRYDVTIDGATSPTDPAVQTAVAAARESLRAAGATGGARVVVGTPVRELAGSETTTDVRTANTASQPAVGVHTTPAGVFQVSPPPPGVSDEVAVYIGPTLVYIGDLTSRGSAQLFLVASDSNNVDIFSERTGTVTTTRTTTDTNRTLLTVEVIGEAGPVDARPRVFSTTTLVDEVVTNTPRVVERYDTRVLVGNGNGFAFDQTLPVRYDPAGPTDPSVAASIAAAQAVVNPADPASVRVTTNSTIDRGAVSDSATDRPYSQTFRRLTGNDTVQVEIGRTDTAVETVTVETAGPATVRVGPNGADTLFVPAGTLHVNTVTRVRRDIATATTQTFTTTQLVLVGGVGSLPGSGHFTISSRTRPSLVTEDTTATAETAATRVVATFGGVRYDVTLDVPYDPTNPAVQAAIAAAQAAVRAAGATTGARVTVGAPVRGRVSSAASVGETTTTGEFVNGGGSPHSLPVGVHAIVPPPAADEEYSPGFVNYIGPTLYFAGDEFADVVAVGAGTYALDLLQDRTAVTTRTRTTTDTLQTLTTIEVVGEAANRLFSTTTLVDEVVTNTLRVVEQFDTRVLVPNFQVPGFAFDQTAAEAYNPADADVAALVGAAQAAANPGNPAATNVITSARIQITGQGGLERTYPQTFRRLTGNDTTPVEIGRADTVLETVMVETVGPATVRVGPNAADTLFVPAGSVHTNTVTRLRRDVSTATTQTFTTTQLVLVTPRNDGPGGGGSQFSQSYLTRPSLVTTDATDVRESAATRVVGTFGGVRYDVLLDVPYDPTNPAVQAAISAAQASLRAAGATTERVIVGAPARGLASSVTSVGEAMATGEFEFGGASHSPPDGVYSIVPPQPGEAFQGSFVEGQVNYIGPTVYYTSDDLASVAYVAEGANAFDTFLIRDTVTTRARTTTDTFQTVITVEVVGETGHVFLRAVGADTGGAPRVRAVRADGTVALDTFAFESTFTGGVRVATGDVTGDSVDDVLTAAGDGGGPRVRIFDGATGATVRDFFAFPDTLRVGAFVATADVNGDGFADYAVSAGSGGGPRVALFDGRTGARLLDFLAFDADDRHGLTVALGDVTGDGVADISVGALAGGTAVRVFDLNGNPLAGFDAYEPGFSGGVYLAVADSDGDGLTELLTGAGPGGAPRVRGFRVGDGSVKELANGFRFDPAGRDGVRVGTGTDVVTAAATGRVRLFPTAGGADPTVEAPLGDGYFGGLWVS